MYSNEIKTAAAEMHAEGRSASYICSELGICRSTLFLWLKEARPDDIGRIPREEYLKEKELKRLRIENRIYRTTGCTPSSPLSDKLLAIDQHKDEFNVGRLCRTLEVRKSTYYHYALRSPEKTRIQLMDEQLSPLIRDIFSKSRETFGAQRIRVKLRDLGYVVSARRISRLMKEMGLNAKGPRPKINSANDRQYIYYPNKLKRNFITDAPNTIWASDVTYAKIDGSFLYLCVVIDLYSRKVISYKISDKIDTALVKQTFVSAFESRGCPKNLIFHSDQGSQYTSFAFRMYLRNKGVTPSYSCPGTPQDNAVVESFFASIKKEDFRRKLYRTRKELEKAVREYIEFYNDYRPHQKLRYLTPNQAELEYKK